MRRLASSRQWGVVAFVVLLLQGCASVTTGNTQNVSVETTSGVQSVSGATCDLSNDKGRWSLMSPGTTTVRSSYQDLSVRCESEAYEPGVATFKSTTKGMAFGNIILGGLIGATIDVASGAAYQYPSLLTVTMGRPTGKVPAVPEATVARSSAQSIEVGDVWEYRIVDGYTQVARNAVWTVDSVADGQIRFNGGSRIEDREKRSVVTTAPSAGDMEAFEPPGGWARPGVAGGQSWDVTYEAQDGLPRSRMELRASVPRKETVRTPAGVFQTWVVEYRGSALRHTGFAMLPHAALFTVWVDQVSGRVVRFTSDISGSTGVPRLSREQTELVRFASRRG